jgi:hypothetical protein
LAARTGNLLEFVEEPESLEYLQSVRYWPTPRQPGHHGTLRNTVAHEAATLPEAHEEVKTSRA